jgi:hypothetical protein
MANMEKYNRSATGNMTKHYERGLNLDGKKAKFGNQDINPELSDLNYNLAPDRDMSQVEFINQRTSEVKCLNRADVNVMCSWVVTAPKELKMTEHKEFFKETHKFLNERYQEHGHEKNVISAYVHLDENQPHMHYAFVPVAKDRKRGHLKVCAKEVVYRKDLRSFHQDLSKHMEKHFGRDIGILNGTTIEGNKAIDELKRKSASERLKEVEIQSDKLLNKTQSKADEVLSEVSRLEAKLEVLKVEYGAKKAYIDEAKSISEVSMKYPTWAEQTTKGIINKKELVTVPKEKWEAKHISANEISSIIKEREALEEKIETYKKYINEKNYFEIKKEAEKWQNKYLKLHQKYQKRGENIIELQNYSVSLGGNPKDYKEYQKSFDEFKAMMNKKASYSSGFIMKLDNYLNNLDYNDLDKSQKKSCNKVWEVMESTNQGDITIFTKKDREFYSKVMGREVTFKDLYKFKGKQFRKAVVNTTFDMAFSPKKQSNVKSAVAKYQNLLQNQEQTLENEQARQQGRSLD